MILLNLCIWREAVDYEMCSSPGAAVETIRISLHSDGLKVHLYWAKESELFILMFWCSLEYEIQTTITSARCRIHKSDSQLASK